MRVFAVYTKEFAARSKRRRNGWKERKREAEGETRSEVDGGERGRAGVLLRGSVVKRIDPNHYDMSRLRFAASTMAGSSPESERLQPPSVT